MNTFLRMSCTTLFVNLFVIVCLSLNAQTKRALVIGVGQYEDPEWGIINGDKDVLYVNSFLEKAMFPNTNIQKLVNQQATKSAIVDAFKTLAWQSNKGDIVYVHFSGHGQQMKDMNNDEKDGLDECWIPYDAYRKPCDKDRGEKHLSDDEVNCYLNIIRDKIGDSGKLLVVIDACHSGDATRGEDDEVVRGVTDIFEAIKSMLWHTSIGRGSSDVNPDARLNDERWITISACKSDQVNTEMRNPAVGKLTYALSEILKNNKVLNNNELIDHLERFVDENSGSRPQHPVVTGEDVSSYLITDILIK